MQIRVLSFVSGLSAGRSAAISSASHHISLHEGGAEEDQVCAQDRAPPRAKQVLSKYVWKEWILKNDLVTPEGILHKTRFSSNDGKPFSSTG